MNVIVPIKSLSKALATIVPAVPSNPSIRALKCVRIDAQDRITIRATDLTTFVRADVDGEVMRPGSFLVDAKSLFEIVRVLPAASSNITLELVAKKLRILCGNAKHTIATLDVDEAPVWPRDFELDATVKAADMKRGFQIVAHAANDDDNGSHLASVKVVSAEGKMTMVTTDGHRLAMTSIPCAATFDALLPIKAVSSILRVLDGAEGEDVRFGYDGAQYAGIRTATHEIVMRTLDAENFPPWSRVLPAASKNRATLCRDIFVSALRNVEVASRTNLKDAGRVSHVQIRLRDGNVVLDGANTDGAEAHDEIDCDYAGEEMLLGVNAIYMIQTLNAMTSDDVVIDLADPLAAMRVEPASDDPSLFVIMPVRV